MAKKEAYNEVCYFWKEDYFKHGFSKNKCPETKKAKYGKKTGVVSKMNI